MRVEKKKPEQRVTFTKEQLCSSAKYADRRDLLGALLKSGEVYTFEEVDALIEKFLKGQVK